MIPLYIASLLGAFGYYLSVDKKQSRENIHKNNSKIDRIHLVVDCYCNAILKGLVLGDTR